jgi:hypothetical protein
MRFRTSSGALYELDKDTVTRIAEHPCSRSNPSRVLNREPYTHHSGVRVGSRVLFANESDIVVWTSRVVSIDEES